MVKQPSTTKASWWIPPYSVTNTLFFNFFLNSLCPITSEIRHPSFPGTTHRRCPEARGAIYPTVEPPQRAAPQRKWRHSAGVGTRPQPPPPQKGALAGRLCLHTHTHAPLTPCCCLPSGRSGSPGGGPVALLTAPSGSICPSSLPPPQPPARCRHAPRSPAPPRARPASTCNGRGKMQPGGQRCGPGRHWGGGWKRAGAGVGVDDWGGNGRGRTQQPFLTPAPAQAPAQKVDASAEPRCRWGRGPAPASASPPSPFSPPSPGEVAPSANLRPLGAAGASSPLTESLGRAGVPLPRHLLAPSLTTRPTSEPWEGTGRGATGLPAPGARSRRWPRGWYGLPQPQPLPGGLPAGIVSPASPRTGMAAGMLEGKGVAGTARWAPEAERKTSL